MTEPNPEYACAACDVQWSGVTRCWMCNEPGRVLPKKAPDELARMYATAMREGG